MVPENKVYTVLVSFENEGLTYEAGKQYELSDEVVASLAEGTVEAFVAPENANADLGTDNADANTGTGIAPAEPTPAEPTPAEPTPAEPTPATPWAGGHKV